MKQETNMEHSAEWLRGAYRIASRYAPMDVVMQINVLLAAAEAREAAQPSAAEVKKQIIAEYIDMNGSTCDCCQHVMIDVTAAETGAECHCMAGDPEGEGSGCAWGWAETAENRQLALEKAAEVIRVAKAALKPFGDGAVMSRIGRKDYSAMRERIVDWHGPSDFRAAKKALATISAWEAGNA